MDVDGRLKTPVFVILYGADRKVTIEPSEMKDCWRVKPRAGQGSNTTPTRELWAQLPAPEMGRFVE